MVRKGIKHIYTILKKERFLTQYGKQIIGVLLLIAFATIMFSNLYDTKRLSMSEAIKTGLNYSKTTMILTIFATIVHMLYLYILLDILIFKHQIEKRIVAYKILIPVFLVLAYICSALTSWAKVDISGYELVDIFNITSFLFFGLLYICWALNDFKTSKRWFYIDVASILLLIFFYFISFENQWLTFFASPNGVVIICLALYFIFSLSSQEYRDSNYKSAYEAYRRYNTIEERPSIEIDFGCSSGINILDYGCGSGERLVEYNSLITPCFKDIPINKITGCDRLSCYKANFTTQATSLSPTALFKEKVTMRDFSEANLVILSHVIYEYDTVKNLISYLRKCQSGTVVLIRVCSPNSFFVPVSIAGADNIFSFKKNRGHLGYIWIKKIIESAQYTKIATYTVKQTYSISDETRIECASKLLQFLYDSYLAYCIEDYLTALKENGITSIPNDDLIYILQKD
jgi:hypothetical protein